MNLRENELKIDSKREISRLQLLLRKSRSEKLCALDFIIMLLKQVNDFSKENYIIMALTRKVALLILNLILHSHKNSLSLPIQKQFKNLNSKLLKYY